MAGRIREETKQRLRAAGQWQRFLKIREERKAQGFAPGDARSAAVREALAQCNEGSDKTPLAGVDPGSLPVAPPELASAVAAEPEVVRWVARHIDVREPDPATCPDPFAWTLLRMCRSDPGFTAWFVDKLWSKLIPSRSQLDTKVAGDFDGQVTIELLERIQAMRDEAIQEAAMACPSGQHSSPPA